MSNQVFTLTDTERSFVAHFSYEIFTGSSVGGQAISWMNSRGLHWNLLAGFQRWIWLNDPLLDQWISSQEKLPLFQVPWEGVPQFLERVEASLSVYPDLRPLIDYAMEHSKTCSGSSVDTDMYYQDPAEGYHRYRPERLMAEYLQSCLRDGKNLPAGLPSLFAAHIDVIEEIGGNSVSVIAILPEDDGFTIEVRYTPPGKTKEPPPRSPAVD